ncbi:MAG: hypothetical protein JO234_15545, partial [Hyphomicrobiales bacterium]|nr:hypothetical protein [Hyphomicrobiales bacterium]
MTSARLPSWLGRSAVPFALIGASAVVYLAAALFTGQYSQVTAGGVI